MKITYIGLGHVGLTNSVILASYGNEVIGYDNDKDKVALLKQGVSIIEEKGLQELLTEYNSKIRFTANAKDAIRHSNMFIIAVDTPLTRDGKTDLSNLKLALIELADNVTQNSIVIIRSTLPIGETRKAKEYLENNSSYRFEVFNVPEFFYQGGALEEIKNPSRLIIGSDDPVEKESISKAIAMLLTNNNKKVPVVLTSFESAEIIKEASNSYLAMRLSFINSVARLAEDNNGNIDDIVKGLGYDPRIGDKYLNPSLGFGGDGLSNILSDDSWKELSLLRATIEENDKQLEYFLNKIFKRYKSLNNMTIAILGVGYKGDVEDINNSRAIKAVRALLEKGAHINIYDPVAEDAFHKAFSRYTHISYVDYPCDALNGAECALILNDSIEFKELTANDFVSSMKRPVVFDGYNLYSPADMVGVEYHSIGRKTINKK